MKLKHFIFLLFLIALNYCCKAQLAFQAHAGFGYIEHFSAGVGVNFSQKHSVSLHYGSNFFVRPQKFSSYMLQYRLMLMKWQSGKITPAVGLRGGHSIFSDDYYTWDLAVFVPFVGIQFAINRKTQLVLEAGGAFSFEQSVKRLSYGEIGHYRDILPEGKVGVVYNLVKTQ